jgi:hypothetical protein
VASSPPDFGSPGATARRERDPSAGGALVALQEDLRHQFVRGRRVDGGEQVAEFLAANLNDDVVVLHDRAAPACRARIDHIAVAPSGVWVIDSKRYRGRVAISRPLFGRAKLWIGGRNRTKLIDGLSEQVAVVEAVLLAAGPGIPLRGALCFVDTGLPRFGKLAFDGYLLLYPKGLATRINADGPVDAERIAAVAAELALRLPVA